MIFDREYSFREHGEVPQFPGNFEILPPRKFFHDFQEHALQAQKRVYAQTMYVEPGIAFNAIAESLINAQERGLDTKLHFDYYSFLIDGQQLAWVPAATVAQRRARRQTRAAKMQTITDIENAGVEVTVSNIPSFVEKLLPFKGRNHTKLAIIDDVAWIGGLSYRDDDLDKEDFMMRITDPSIVAVLEKQFHRVNEQKPSEDIVEVCNDMTAVFLDRGDRGKSKILDFALQAIRGAEKSIKLATQYNVNGRMSKTLYNAYALNKNISTYVSSHDSIIEWYGRVLHTINNFVDHARRRSIPTFSPETRVHAKALLIDEDIPERAIGIVGSHNFVGSGVTLGTQELCLASRDPRFIANLSRYFHNLENKSIKGGELSKLS